MILSQRISALPSVFLARSQARHAAHPLWADCHNISESSLREGWLRYLASDVNLLTADAIPHDNTTDCVHWTTIVAFSPR